MDSWYLFVVMDSGGIESVSRLNVPFYWAVRKGLWLLVRNMGGGQRGGDADRLNVLFGWKLR